MVLDEMTQGKVKLEKNRVRGQPGPPHCGGPAEPRRDDQEGSVLEVKGKPAEGGG